MRLCSTKETLPIRPDSLETLDSTIFLPISWGLPMESSYSRFIKAPTITDEVIETTDEELRQLYQALNLTVGMFLQTDPKVIIAVSHDRIEQIGWERTSYPKYSGIFDDQLRALRKIIKLYKEIDANAK